MAEAGGDYFDVHIAHEQQCRTGVAECVERDVLAEFAFFEDRGEVTPGDVVDGERTADLVWEY